MSGTLPGTAGPPPLPTAPRVSVITIFLDARAYLAEAIESVLRQTYGGWELLLVDDGSTDGSPEIARGYAAAHPTRVRYLEHPRHQNLGMSASRNAGLREARGELVALLDADDAWLPEKLEQQVRAIDAHPEAAMVYNATLLWYSWTGDPADAGRDVARRLGVAAGAVIFPPALVPLYLRRVALPPATCGVLVRRSAALGAGGFEREFRGMFEDQVFFYKIALAHPVYVLAGHWDLYRQHPASHCHAAERQGVYRDGMPSEAERSFLEWLERHVAEVGGGTAAVRAALHWRLRPYRQPRRHRVEQSLAKVVRGLRRAVGSVRRWARGIAGR
jgi:glycosyltransferase involved in cell wall biosynthesis